MFDPSSSQPPYWPGVPGDEGDQLKFLSILCVIVSGVAQWLTQTPPLAGRRWNLKSNI